jgi:hypothetical protein
METSETHLRVLFCDACGTLEELPYYDGKEEVDPYVEGILLKHNQRDPMAHGGVRLKASPIIIYVISKEEWATKRHNVIANINERNKRVGMTTWVDESFNTYQEDALRCFREHHRPQEGCIDNWDDSKRIGRPTDEGKQAVKENYKLGKSDPHLCQFCFDGSTKVITRTGTYRIDELAAIGHAELLVPPTHGKWATWRDCEIRSFGRQRLWQITLKRGRREKVVWTTEEHSWYLTNEQEYRTSHKRVNARRTTTDLKTGDSLEYGQAPPLKLYESLSGFPVVPSAFGIAQGFVFGDGTAPGSRSGIRTQQPAHVRLYGAKDKALLPYFASANPQQISLGDNYNDDYAWDVKNLPRAWKAAPDLDESLSFLLGWLAGYFAADGTVDKNGSASLESGNRSHLEIARTICYRLGVMTEEITSKIRLGKGKHPSPLYKLWIYANDLPESFWLIDHHRSRVALRSGERKKPQNWTVVSVEQSERTTEVYCAVVPDNAKFVLTDNLVTGNCPVHTYVETNLRARAGLYK